MTILRKGDKGETVKLLQRRLHLKEDGIFGKLTEEAVKEFEKDPLMKEVLGEEVCGKYVKAKMAEWETYNRQVSDWEVDNYLLRI